MAAYAQSGVMLALLIAFGWHLVKLARTKAGERPGLNTRLVRWTGYGLIVMTIILIGLEVQQHFAEEVHRRGH
ncbi:MAG: hypothetical protein K0Q94_3178 [Paenibacillus sp.]|jgi:hypothetical protein|nr:hypothetical protein [Paenibacillus sp.]